jgi:pyruvate kinase
MDPGYRKAASMRRRAKIVCTLGPATSGQEQIAALIAAGLDVARFNMSHGTHDTHLAAYRAVRAASDAAGRSVGVLVDLQGPKIRLGRFPSGPVTLVAGQQFTITTDDVPGTVVEASTTYEGLPADVGPETPILVDDGRVVLEVEAVRGTRVRTRVLIGGEVSDHKGLNLPGVRVSVPALTAKDEADLRWALALRADMVALSFVQGPEDSERALQIMGDCGSRLPLIAKIEKPQAVQAHPGRGIGCRECRFRRGGRADAVGGNECGRLPRPDGVDHGQDHPGGRERDGNDFSAARKRTVHHRWCHRERCRRGGGGGRREGAGGLHDDG